MSTCDFCLTGSDSLYQFPRVGGAGPLVCWSCVSDGYKWLRAVYIPGLGPEPKTPAIGIQEINKLCRSCYTEEPNIPCSCVK